MKIKRIHSTFKSGEKQWHSKIIEVKKITFEQAVKGDLVYIEGSLVDGRPTAVYGPHKVHNTEKQQLMEKVLFSMNEGIYF